MNNKDLNYFTDIKANINLLTANWNALKSNPPCERNISEILISSKELINNWEEQIRYDNKKYEHSRMLNRLKKKANCSM
nr:MAG TPA: hypothetical protein [Caudoviricetes sp.]